MDPFSVAAGAAGLATLCAQCSKILYSFYENTQKVDAQVIAFCNEIDTLAQVLEALGTNLKHPRTLAVIKSAHQDYDGKLWTNVNSLMEKCRRSMETLKAILHRLNRDTGGILKKPIKALRLRLQRDDILELRGQIQSHGSMMQITLQSISIWLHLESSATGRDGDVILNTKLDEIKEQMSQIQSRHAAKTFTQPLQNVNSLLEQDGEDHKPSASLLPALDKPNNDIQAGNSKVTADLQADLVYENQGFQKALEDCVHSVDEFVSNIRTVLESRASATGSTKGFGLASVAGEPLTTDRQLGIEKWMAAHSLSDKAQMDKGDMTSLESSGPSLAERQFVEACEEIEQLGRDNKHEEAADVGMRYLQELWEEYGTRLREYYRSNSYMSTYMTDEKHGQQLRRSILGSHGRGFNGPERASNNTYKVLHFLAQIGSLAEFRLLHIRTNGDPNIRDHKRKTPLIRAAHKGHESIVAYLLEVPGIAVNIRNKEGYTALDYATINNHADIVALLLRHLTKEPVKDQYYIARSFQLAARYGRLSIIRLFVSAAEVDVNRQSDDQQTALHDAILQDRFAIVKFLLKEPNIDIERTNGEDETPVLYAARLQRRFILHELLGFPRVNVDHGDSKGRTALSYVAAGGDEDSVKRILQLGGNPGIADKYGILPITYAASRGYYEARTGKFVFPSEKQNPKKHHDMVGTFLDFYGLEQQPPEDLDQYISLCTQHVESVRVGNWFLPRPNLDSRWFEKASPKANSEQDKHIMSSRGSYITKDNKSHHCPIPTCGRLFKRLENLKRHIRTHTLERQYRCPHCNKVFSGSDSLAQHRLTHEARPEDEVGTYSEEELKMEENEYGALDEESPSPDHNGYLPPSTAGLRLDSNQMEWAHLVMYHPPHDHRPSSKTQTSTPTKDLLLGKEDGETSPTASVSTGTS